MKTLKQMLLLLTIMTAGNFANAQHYNNNQHRNLSQLVIKIENTRFAVVIDDRYYHQNQSVFKSDLVSPGKHHILVLKNTRVGNVPMMEVLYRGEIFLQPNQVSFAKVTLARQLYIKRTAPLNRKHTNDNDLYDDNRNHSDNNNHWHSDDYQTSVGMSAEQFAQVRQLTATSAYETDKLIIAKEAVKKYGASALQIKELMMEFKFEKSKLEFAKYAYEFCADKSEYHAVNQAFEYNSSVTELNTFLSGR